MSDDYGGAEVMPAPSTPSSSTAASNMEGREEPEFDPSIPEDERRFYMKAYPTVDLVRERKVHCTICKAHIGTAPAMESIIKMHPVLRVTHCTKCHDFYNSGEFSKGEDGSELYCRWCGQGGEVYCCSSCPYVFCKSCITKNLSRGVVADIEQNENWNCFNCSTKILWPLRAQHWALVKYIEQQKKLIKDNTNLSEGEIKKLMAEDRSTCCRLAKAKCGNMSDSLESIDSSTSRRSIGGATIKKIHKPPTPHGITPPAKRQKTSNDEVVCEPDLLSMLEPDCQITESPKTSGMNRSAKTPSNSVPRIMTIQTNNAGYSLQAKSSAPPPLVLRNTSIKVNRAVPSSSAPVRQNVAQPRNPVPAQRSAPTTPVYHTINGFRIDLNSAAKHETFRLPNGKLIQVKRQGVGQQDGNSPIPGAQPVQNFQMQRTIVPVSQPRCIQFSAPTNGTPQFQPVAITSHVAPPPQQQPAVIRYHNTVISNNGPQVAVQNGSVHGVQVVNGIPTAPVQVTPVALQGPAAGRAKLVKHVFADSPFGQARTQLQAQIFGAMDICQHLANKIHSLTNSNAYKTARNYLEIKELYIHMSYLLTYGIGRFKGLQEKCLADMRQLGFVNDADCLENGQLAADKQASDDEDNEIEIVEPKTDTITLDSDDEETPPARNPLSKSPQKTIQKSSGQSLLKPASIQSQSLNGTTITIGNTTLHGNRPVQIQPAQIIQTRAVIQPKVGIRPQPSLPRLQIVQTQSLTGSNNVAIRHPAPLPGVISNLSSSISVKPATSTTSNSHTARYSLDSSSSPNSTEFPENVDFMSAAQTFLASMLEVEISEGEGPATAPAPKSKKQPRKKTTNKPNPQLLELERQRLEDMKQNDAKLKMKCKVNIIKAEFVYPDLKQIMNEEKAEEEAKKLAYEKGDEDDSILGVDSDLQIVSISSRETEDLQDNIINDSENSDKELVSEEISSKGVEEKEGDNTLVTKEVKETDNILSLDKCLEQLESSNEEQACETVDKELNIQESSLEKLDKMEADKSVFDSLDKIDEQETTSNESSENSSTVLDNINAENERSINEETPVVSSLNLIDGPENECNKSSEALCSVSDTISAENKKSVNEETLVLSTLLNKDNESLNDQEKCTDLSDKPLEMSDKILDSPLEMSDKILDSPCEEDVNTNYIDKEKLGDVQNKDVDMENIEENQIKEGNVLNSELNDPCLAEISSDDTCLAEINSATLEEKMDIDTQPCKDSDNAPNSPDQINFDESMDSIIDDVLLADVELDDQKNTKETDQSESLVDVLKDLDKALEDKNSSLNSSTFDVFTNEISENKPDAVSSSVTNDIIEKLEEKNYDEAQYVESSKLEDDIITSSNTHHDINVDSNIKESLDLIPTSSKIDDTLNFEQICQKNENESNSTKPDDTMSSDQNRQRNEIESNSTIECNLAPC